MSSIPVSVGNGEASLLEGLRIRDGEEPSLVRLNRSFARPIGQVDVGKKKPRQVTRLFFVWLLERDSNPRPDG